MNAVIMIIKNDKTERYNGLWNNNNCNDTIKNDSKKTNNNNDHSIKKEEY